MVRVFWLVLLTMTLGALTPAQTRAAVAGQAVEKAAVAEESCARRPRLTPGVRAQRRQMVQVVRPRYPQRRYF